MSQELSILALSAATIAFIHTLLGPDHYLPFIAMARAQGWSPARTAAITALCGAGHILSSILLGAVGIALGLATSFFEPLDAIRGSLAAWAFMGFGLVYLAWGLRQARKNAPHSPAHPHLDGHVHAHGHTHGGVHVHIMKTRGASDRQPIGGGGRRPGAEFPAGRGGPPGLGL